ncbi:hypothetical protein Celaphus_00000120 [Cervus elaphus hippelaphus]|uniref:Uncharacterized protein n=1 Tax=Cervus elaphus hippelaphus TaxID=46360 RepID=A0A212D9K4_CEREH|nr:hypothetical protein Celaphus_00000120 [Cervus elaphus hippelaphus]
MQRDCPLATAVALPGALPWRRTGREPGCGAQSPDPTSRLGPLGFPRDRRAVAGRGKRGRGFSGDPARPILFRNKGPLLWKPEPRAGGDGGSWVVTDLLSPGDARPRLLRECTCPPAREREFSMDTA